MSSDEITCQVCGASQWPTADCYACGHPFDADALQDHEGDEG